MPEILYWSAGPVESNNILDRSNISSVYLSIFSRATAVNTQNYSIPIGALSFFRVRQCDWFDGCAEAVRHVWSAYYVWERLPANHGVEVRCDNLRILKGVS